MGVGPLLWTLKRSGKLRVASSVRIATGIRPMNVPLVLRGPSSQERTNHSDLSFGGGEHEARGTDGDLCVVQLMPHSGVDVRTRVQQQLCNEQEASVARKHKRRHLKQRCAGINLRTVLQEHRGGRRLALVRCPVQGRHPLVVCPLDEALANIRHEQKFQRTCVALACRLQCEYRRRGQRSLAVCTRQARGD